MGARPGSRRTGPPAPEDARLGRRRWPGLGRDLVGDSVGTWPLRPLVIDCGPGRIECDNPLKTVPYQPTSDAERDIVKAFQQLETAVVRNDAEEWVDHVADEFVVTRTG